VQQPLKQRNLFEMEAPAGTVSVWAELAEAERSEVVTALARVMAKIPRTWIETPKIAVARKANDE